MTFIKVRKEKTMNFTYEELRRMFENGKVEAKKSIAAYLIQESSVSNPKTAKQISDALNAYLWSGVYLTPA